MLVPSLFNKLCVDVITGGIWTMLRVYHALSIECEPHALTHITTHKGGGLWLTVLSQFDSSTTHHDLRKIMSNAEQASM